MQAVTFIEDGTQTMKYRLPDKAPQPNLILWLLMDWQILTDETHWNPHFLFFFNSLSKAVEETHLRVLKQPSLKNVFCASCPHWPSILLSFMVV